jgi:hypothetical protein
LKDISTPDFSTNFNCKLQKLMVEKSGVERSFLYKVKGQFNPGLLNPVVQKFIEKSRVEKFMIEKSWVERSGVEKS